MKQTKNLMMYLLMMVVMGLTMTSCLDSSETESTYDAAGLMRASTSYMGTPVLKDLNDKSYIPTTASVAAMKENGYDITTADLSVVYFKWAEGSSAASATPSIVLVHAAAINTYNAEYAGTKEDMEANYDENAPIVGIALSSAFGTAMYGDELLLVDLGWKQSDKTLETAGKHTFDLVYVPDAENKSTMTCYLRHINNEEDTSKCTQQVTMTVAYDIEQYLTMFKSTHGQYPTTIMIKHRVGADQTLPSTYTDCSITTYLNSSN